MIASDKTIKELVRDFNMISPFVPESVNYIEGMGKVPSFGLSCAGYDVRLERNFKLFCKPHMGKVIDILDFKEDDFCESFTADSIIIPPGGLLLGNTVEYFKMPTNVLGTCVGKSTWARLGGSVLVTPLEPGWEGQLVVEITNGTNHPLKIYAGVGVAQIQFALLDQEPDMPYNSRNGKYQGQRGVQRSIL